MYPLVRVRVSFILVSVITEITVKPNSTFVLFYVPVQVTHIFEAFVTVLFHTLQASISSVSNFVLGKTTFKWESHATSITYQSQFLVYINMFFQCTSCGETFPAIITKLYIMGGTVVCIKVFHTCCRFSTDFAFKSLWSLVFFQFKTACHKHSFEGRAGFHM